jgi:hypothetical protein
MHQSIEVGETFEGRTHDCRGLSVDREPHHSKPGNHPQVSFPGTMARAK